MSWKFDLSNKITESVYHFFYSVNILIHFWLKQNTMTFLIGTNHDPWLSIRKEELTDQESDPPLHRFLPSSEAIRHLKKIIFQIRQKIK